MDLPGKFQNPRDWLTTCMPEAYQPILLFLVMFVLFVLHAGAAGHSTLPFSLIHLFTFAADLTAVQFLLSSFNISLSMGDQKKDVHQQISTEIVAYRHYDSLQSTLSPFARTMIETWVIRVPKRMSHPNRHRA